MPNYHNLSRHIGHTIGLATYGPETIPVNIAIECETCHEVIVDRDRPDAERTGS